MRRTTQLRRTSVLARGQLRRVIRARPGYSGARRKIWLRCHGRCELCGYRVPPDVFDAHHRQSRAVGGDCPCNLLCLCSGCHTGGPDAVHANPALSSLHGLIISRHDTREHFPDVPVQLRRDIGWVKLRCDGSQETLDAPPSGD